MVDRDVDDALARSFLAELPAELAGRLRTEGERADYPAGTTVYRAGSDPRAALVVRGLIRVYLSSPAGRQVTVRYARPGDVLGIAVLVGGPASTSVQAVEPSSVFRISARTLTEAARRDPRVSWAIAEELNRRLFEVLEQTAVNAFGSVRQRVAAHIGGLRELTGSELLVSAAEWAELAKPAPELRGYLHSHIQLPGLRWHRVSLEPTDDPALAPFTESLDVMGDGSLVLLPTPGHTAGSVSLLVRRGARPPLLLAGDLTYGAEILQRGQLPGVGNRRRLAESSRKVLALAGQQPGLVVLPAHDPTAAQRLLDSLGDDMEIDLREPVRLGESTQWIRIRAANARNPLLLLVQQGPGLPMINEVRTFERLLSLEDDFTVIYWDQRGCGRSLRSADATRDLSIQTMVSDTERLLAMLCDRFDTPAVVAGFSMGATIAALAAARRPDLVATLVAVSMDIDGAAAGKNAYEFALATAQARKNHRAVRQLKAIGPPPHLEPEGFATRARWAANFGGVRTGQTYNSMARGLLVSLLRSPDYSLADAARAIRGITATQAALLPELEALDLTDTLPRLNCPIVMVQGRHDQVAPASSAERYAELLKAPSKQFVWFEHSAHMPQLDEPERFRELLAKVRLGLPANA